MVRVLDTTPDPAVVKRCSCKECAARLEYVRNDVRSHYATDYGGGGDTYYWIVCPNCGKDVYVERP